eukprot:454039-Alexandrium_andersonii.AAC.1
MSASLVGSEMCIRDRLEPAYASSRMSWEMAHRPPPPNLRLQPRVCEPVSYTHLTLPTICSV